MSTTQPWKLFLDDKRTPRNDGGGGDDTPYGGRGRMDGIFAATSRKEFEIRRGVGSNPGRMVTGIDFIDGPGRLSRAGEKRLMAAIKSRLTVGGRPSLRLAQELPRSTEKLLAICHD